MTQNELNFLNEAMVTKCEKIIKDIIEADTLKKEKAEKPKKSKKENEE